MIVAIRPAYRAIAIGVAVLVTAMPPAVTNLVIPCGGGVPKSAL